MVNTPALPSVYINVQCIKRDPAMEPDLHFTDFVATETERS